MQIPVAINKYPISVAKMKCNGKWVLLNYEFMDYAWIGISATKNR